MSHIFFFILTMLIKFHIKKYFNKIYRLSYTCLKLLKYYQKKTNIVRLHIVCMYVCLDKLRCLDKYAN